MCGRNSVQKLCKKKQSAKSSNYCRPTDISNSISLFRRGTARYKYTEKANKKNDNQDFVPN